MYIRTSQTPTGGSSAHILACGNRNGDMMNGGREWCGATSDLTQLR